jgi:hypothetical protein
MKTLIAALLFAVAISATSFAAPRCADPLVKCDGTPASAEKGEKAAGEDGDNGHGNDADGRDSSNPGKGRGDRG